MWSVLANIQVVPGSIRIWTIDFLLRVLSSFLCSDWFLTHEFLVLELGAQNLICIG
jgi:hypothetical protein